MYSVGLGETRDELRAQAQSEIARIERAMAGVKASLLAETARGNNPVGVKTMSDLYKKLNAERAVWFKVLNGSELTATDRAILSVGGVFVQGGQVLGDLGKGLASAAPLLVPGLIALGIIVALRR